MDIKGPHNWPTISPDITPLNFYMWGHMTFWSIWTRFKMQLFQIELI